MANLSSKGDPRPVSCGGEERAYGSRKNSAAPLVELTRSVGPDDRSTWATTTGLRLLLLLTASLLQTTYFLLLPTVTPKRLASAKNPLLRFYMIIRRHVGAPVSDMLAGPVILGRVPYFWIEPGSPLRLKSSEWGFLRSGFFPFPSCPFSEFL